MPDLRISGLCRDYGNGEGLRPSSAEIHDGELFVLLGPSGSGKSTLLRIIAGFETPDAGSVVVGDRDITGLPPERRPTSMVFQSHALWPHLTVAQNIGFGLTVQRRPKSQVEARVGELLRLVQLEGMERRKPRQLSGGQRQRVALARSLAVEPEVLLLDEPLSSLDARLREQLRVELRQLLGQLGLTAIYVTHDQEDALELADRIGVLNKGELVQVGTPEDVYERPASRFVAEFCGNSILLPCQPVGEAAGGARQVRLGTGDIVETAGGDPDGEWIAIRSEAVEVLPATSTQGLAAQVTDQRYHSGRTRLTLGMADISFSVDVQRPAPSVGDACRVLLPADRCWQVGESLSSDVTSPELQLGAVAL